MPYGPAGGGVTLKQLRDELSAMETRLKDQVAKLVQDGTDKILAAVAALAETKADKDDEQRGPEFVSAPRSRDDW